MVERTAVESRAEEEVAQEKSAWGLGLPYRLVLDVSTIEMNDEQFFQFCAANGDLRIELTAERELIVMPPEGLTTGARSARLSQRLANWAEQDGTGLVFGSSTGFTFPNGAVRSPDASWVPSERWEALPGDEKVRFGHICPDFVVEIRSPSDRLPDLQAKMAEYVDNGVRLGWADRLRRPDSRGLPSRSGGRALGPAGCGVGWAGAAGLRAQFSGNLVISRGRSWTHLPL